MVLMVSKRRADSSGQEWKGRSDLRRSKNVSRIVPAVSALVGAKHVGWQLR